MKQEIFLLNGTLFAHEFVRVVHGGRGPYVEFRKEQIIPEIRTLYENDVSNTDVPFYYYWMYPETDRNTKIYYQLKTVKYADYKVGMYYVSPTMFKNFQDPLVLF